MLGCPVTSLFQSKRQPLWLILREAVAQWIFRAWRHLPSGGPLAARWTWGNLRSYPVEPVSLELPADQMFDQRREVRRDRQLGQRHLQPTEVLPREEPRP